MKRLLLTILLLLFVFTGCGGNSNPQGRVAIRGEVTFDGKPLEQGSITFSSLPGITPVVSTGTSIENGSFSLPAAHGLIPGQEYGVQFSSIEKIPDKQEKTPARQPKKQINSSTNPVEERIPTRNIIPPQYNSQSKETVTAIKKSPNIFQFHLTSNSSK
jgi:hypothetical protein